MSKLLAGLAGAVVIALTATAAAAAPIGASGTATAGANSSGIILAHGIHKSCERDRRGWHRSRPWGRQDCRRAVNPAVPMALWMWRCADGHCGYWHKKERRWKDGWKGPRHDGRRGKHDRH